MALKTAILGGSFDPVHKGHLYLLQCVLRMTDYQRIVLIPAYLSNFKQNEKATASAEMRLEMLHLALEDFLEENAALAEGKQIVIDDLELQKGGVSYTLDSVKAIRAKYDVSSRLGVIIGDDHLPRLSQWYGFSELKDLVVFLIFRRLGLPNVAPEGTRCIFLDNEIFPLSSTEIRSGLRESDQLSPRVLEYVRRYALYD